MGVGVGKHGEMLAGMNEGWERPPQGLGKGFPERTEPDDPKLGLGRTVNPSTSFQSCPPVSFWPLHLPNPTRSPHSVEVGEPLCRPEQMTAL